MADQGDEQPSGQTGGSGAGVQAGGSIQITYDTKRTEWVAALHVPDVLPKDKTNTDKDVVQFGLAIVATHYKAVDPKDTTSKLPDDKTDTTKLTAGTPHTLIDVRVVNGENFHIQFALPDVALMNGALQIGGDGIFVGRGTTYDWTTGAATAVTPPAAADAITAGVGTEPSDDDALTAAPPTRRTRS